MGEAGEPLRTNRESSAACRDQRDARHKRTLLQPSPPFFFFCLSFIVIYLVRNTQGFFHYHE